MNEPATDKQKGYLLSLMDKRGVSRDEVNVLGLTKREAAGWIQELLERETRKPLPSTAGPHPAVVACETCGVRTLDYEAEKCSGGHGDGPCSWVSSCWNCE